MKKSFREGLMMGCAKCGKSGGCLCPVSLGIAVGLTCFFAMLIWSLWVMQYGVSSDMMTHMPTIPKTLSETFILALWGFLKGLLFGFFIALFYDLIIKCKKCCCKKADG